MPNFIVDYSQSLQHCNDYAVRSDTGVDWRQGAKVIKTAKQIVRVLGRTGQKRVKAVSHNQQISFQEFK